MVSPPPPRGRWAYTTAETRALLVCATCGSTVPSSHRQQHNRWHDFLAELARQLTQPSLLDEEPPF